MPQIYAQGLNRALSAGAQGQGHCGFFCSAPTLTTSYLEWEEGEYYHEKGIARTQPPTNKNYALELPTLGVIVEVSPTDVQWKGLSLEEPPS